MKATTPTPRFTVGHPAWILSDSNTCQCLPIKACEYDADHKMFTYQLGETWWTEQDMYPSFEAAWSALDDPAEQLNIW